MDAAESAPAPWEDPQRRQAAEPGPVLDFNDAGYYPRGFFVAFGSRWIDITIRNIVLGVSGKLIEHIFDSTL